MIDFEYSFEFTKFWLIFPIFVITSISALYTFAIRVQENLVKQKNNNIYSNGNDKSKSLDVAKICKCGGLYWDDRTKNGINENFNLNSNLSVNGHQKVDDTNVDRIETKLVTNYNNNDNKQKTESFKLISTNFSNGSNNNNKNKIRRNLSRTDDSIVLKNIHNRHVVSTMKEMFEHKDVHDQQSTVRTLSPLRSNLNNNRTPVKTDLLKYFGEGTASPSSMKSQRNQPIMRRNLNNNNTIKNDTEKKVNRLSQCSITELLDQLNDQMDLQELCQEFIETPSRAIKPSQIQKSTSQDVFHMLNGNSKTCHDIDENESESDPIQLRQKSISYESLPGSKKLSIFSSSSLSNAAIQRNSRPISTEDLHSFRRSYSSSSNSTNDILTQEIFDAILQNKIENGQEFNISFEDLADALSRCPSEYSFTGLVNTSTDKN